jgi:hypothetical protein
MWYWYRLVVTFVGVCDCASGYGGADCSISVSLAPVVLLEDSNVACDTLNNNCTIAVIKGDRFLNGSTLTCHMTEIQVSGSKFRSYIYLENTFDVSPLFKRVDSYVEDILFLLYFVVCLICMIMYVK